VYISIFITNSSLLNVISCFGYLGIAFIAFLLPLNHSSVSLESCPNRLGFSGSQLTCLNLSDNKLQELPPEIGLLHGLQVLTLERNLLSSLPVSILEYVA